jgi:hypothetical protein
VADRETEKYLTKVRQKMIKVNREVKDADKNEPKRAKLTKANLE